MIVKLYKQRTGRDPVADTLSQRISALGYQLRRVVIEKVLRLEGQNSSELQKFRPLFINPVTECLSEATTLTASEGPIREVSYRRAITDPELASVRTAASALGVVGLKWARLSTRYQFQGLSPAAADEIVTRILCNKTVETVILPGEEWSTLVPQGESGPVECFAIGGMDLASFRELSDKRRLMLSGEQMQKIATLLPSIRDGELEMLAAAWSDHCNHSTWKAMGLFQALKDALQKINHPLVLSALDDNSGVMLFYEGYAICIKGETHISPTFAGDPYGGIMTKHGGVIRDIIFTGQGGWPFAGTTVMGTCSISIPWNQVPPGAIHPLTVVKEAIRGTADYTNPMGIPMAWSQYIEHQRYWKGFALGHSIGILPEKRARKGEPVPGDFVVLIGGETGIDGVHGATVSSGKMTSQTVERDAAHVQIGMPIEERAFMEAIPVLRDADCIRACTDCGAAGLASAVGEIGSDCGVWVNLAWVPLKCSAMKKWEIWLSESQERGVLCVPPERLDKALPILADFGVRATVIGVFTDSARCQVVYNQSVGNKSWLCNPKPIMSGRETEVVVDLPYEFLTSASPLPNIEVRKPASPPYVIENMPFPEDDFEGLVKTLLAKPDICDQTAAANQFDQTVQGNTVVPCIGGAGQNMPDELFVATPIRGESYAAGVANAVNQRYGDVDPAGLGRLMMAQAVGKLVAAGFSPDDITVCANVYTPRVTDNPENAWRLQELVHGYTDASVGLRVPVISGKDSSSGTYEDGVTGVRIDAPLTLDIMALGRMPDAWRLVRKPFVCPGDKIILFLPGYNCCGSSGFAGSLLSTFYGQPGKALPRVELPELRLGWIAYHRFFQSGARIRSRSTVAEGGLVRRLFEMCLGGNVGCSIQIPFDPMFWLFTEFHGAIVFAVPSNDQQWRRHLPFRFAYPLGEVTADPRMKVTFLDQSRSVLLDSPIVELAEGWFKTFAEVVL